MQEGLDKKQGLDRFGRKGRMEVHKNISYSSPHLEHALSLPSASAPSHVSGDQGGHRCRVKLELHKNSSVIHKLGHLVTGFK